MRDGRSVFPSLHKFTFTIKINKILKNLIQNRKASYQDERGIARGQNVGGVVGQGEEVVTAAKDAGPPKHQRQGSGRARRAHRSAVNSWETPCLALALQPASATRITRKTERQLGR